MWRFVSDLDRASVWRYLLGACLLFWLGVGALLASCSPAHAQSATSFTATVGADAWNINGGPARYMPDYSTPREFRSVSGWAKLSGQYATDTDYGTLKLTAQGKMDQVTGNRIDRLDADLRLDNANGVRVGILPYRVSWCRTYDDRSPWMAEPDAFCRFSGLNEISQGAFGAQAYHSTIYKGWLIDAMAGVYRPRVDGQNDKLGPYVSVGPTVMHHAYGASVNALHLPTGVQTRAGWIRTRQNQDDASGSKGAYQRRLEYDSYYLAAEGGIAPGLDLRASLAGYLGSQINPASPYEWDGRSQTIEAIYKPVPGHSIALGLSRYTNRTTYPGADPGKQNLIVPSKSVAWRFDLPDGWWGVLQWSSTHDDYTTRKGAQTVRDGSAVGLRIARTF